MSEIAIGIDLGTSNSCVAVLDGNEVEVLPNAYGEPITASVVALREDGSITVGNAAKANIIHDPKHTIYSSKRLMGRYFFSAEVKKAQAICSYEIAEGPNHSVRLQVADQMRNRNLQGSRGPDGFVVVPDRLMGHAISLHSYDDEPQCGNGV